MSTEPKHFVQRLRIFRVLVFFLSRLQDLKRMFLALLRVSGSGLFQQELVLQGLQRGSCSGVEDWNSKQDLAKRP